jgi:hypothetical protein
MTPDEQQNSDLSLRIAMEKDHDTMIQLVHELEDLTASQETGPSPSDSE